jgi:hypothetical protein
VKRLGPPLADEATRRHQIHLDFMAAVLLAEVDDRDERRRLRRRLADFDFAQSRSVIPATITTLDGGV